MSATTSASNDAYRAGLAAWDAGLSVWPPKQDGSKVPDTKTWTHLQTRRASRDELSRVLRGHTGIGIFCGAMSDDPDPIVAAAPPIEAMDIDCRDTYHAALEAAEPLGLTSLIQRIEAGYCDDTPRGGVRWLYRCPSGDGNLKLARRPATDDELARNPDKMIIVLAETRGRGGFAIVAPSKGSVHETGKPYVRRSGKFSKIATITSDERADLHRLIRTFDRMPVRQAAEPKPTPANGDGTRPGDDYNARVTWPDVIEPHGWTRAYTRRDDVTLWRRPGKQGPGISATTNHAGSDLLCVFSTSTPFETIDAGHTYTKFGAYAVLNHGGDFGAAARALGGQGYGQPRTQGAPEPRSDTRTNSVIASCPPPGSAARDDTATAVLTRLSTVKPIAVEWLWHGRLARGKYTLIAGDPGGGKTSLGLDCASRLSRGSTWPDGGTVPLGTTLLLSAEDGLADTIRPRVDRYGGDPEQITVLEAVRDKGGKRPLDLARDVPILIATIRELRPALVIIDPITAYLGRTDAHRDAEVRGLLAPLQAALDEHHAALLAVAHLNKDQTRAALHRPGGSVAFVAAARLAFALAADPQDDGRRVLAALKTNLCRRPDPLAFRFDEDRLVWEDGPATGMEAETLLRSTSPADREEQTDAERVISELLEDEASWPIDARVALEAGRAHGIPERTMQYAAGRMRIQIRRTGFGGKGRWLWYRPIGATKGAACAYACDVAPMASMKPIDASQSPIDAIDAKKSAFPRAREDDGGGGNGRLL